MFKNRTSGFTLIELLTVIAIIAILAAILIPTLGKVRAQARLSNCVSNLRQWAMANLVHAQDHDGLIPWDGGSNSSPNNVRLHHGTLPWFNALPPYLDSATIQQLSATNSLPLLGDSSLFICPSAQRKNNTPDWLCYGPNYLLSFGGVTTQRPAVTTIDMIRDPTRVALFAETTNHAPGSNGFRAQNANPKHLANATRHEGRAAVAFFDAHVETFTSKELKDQYQKGAEHRYIWNPLHQ